MQKNATNDVQIDLFLERLKQIEIEKFNDATFDNDQFAEAMNMSKSSLYQKMKTTIGLTPSKYIRNVQDLHAEELLLSGAYNISEIAYQIGFNDPQYFSRYFRSKYGLSPRQYRERHQKNRSQKRYQSFLDKANRIIEQNQTVEDYNLEMFAVDMRMSKSTLYRRLKDAVGLSPCEYIRSEKIRTANRLLNNPAFDLLDVANAVGFRDVKYFSRCYKDKFGINPSQIIKDRIMSA